MTHTRIVIKTSVGEMTLRQISEYSGVDYLVIRNRYARGKRGDDLLKPIDTPKTILFRGRERTIREISDETGICEHIIRWRVDSGLEGEDLTKKPNKYNVSHIGEKYDMLTIISQHKKYGDIFVTCKCDCGNTCERKYASLRKSYFHSCGCSHGTTGTHFMSKTKEHKAWRHIKERCLNPNSADYKNYGGRGIKICDRWKNSFESFYEDMGLAPNSSYSIDRIDPNGDYCPENCRWTTWITQTRNKRDTIKFSYLGEEKPLAEWAQILGIKYGTLKAAYHRGEDMNEYIPGLLEKNKRR